MSIAFRINRQARWHDGVKADASDVAYTFKVYTNKKIASPSAEEIRNVDSVTVRDSSTAVFWYHARSAHQLLDATQLMILPRHVWARVAIDSLEAAFEKAKSIGTGRFRFRDWRPKASVELVADTLNYRGRPGVDRLIWSIAPDPNVAVTRLLAGDADVFPALKPQQLREVPRHKQVKVVSLPGTHYAFLGFNLRLRIFSSRELRRALTMAVDRDKIVRNVFDTLAVMSIGPTVRVFPTTNANALKQLPFDPQRAAAMLDSLGWRAGADGVRRRGKDELGFTLLVPTSSAPRMSMAPLIQEQLRRVGVRVEIETIDFTSFQSRLDSHQFDAAIWDWGLGATPSLVESWTSAAAKTGQNYWGYHNPRFDACADSAMLSRDLPSSTKFYTVCYQTIIDDAPAVWLYEPKTVIGLHRRITNGAMRADSWWFDLGSWTIRGEEQIPRDRVHAAQ
jgi:peptide/nickel transport system substrate-binding protein